MKCNFVRPDGTSCKAYAMNSSPYCFTHSPDRAEERAIAVTKGGMAPKKLLLSNNEEIVIENAKDAKVFLSKVINEVWTGKIPATPVANTLGFLIRCFLDALEKSEIEKRLDEIEREVEGMKYEQHKSH